MSAATRNAGIDGPDSLAHRNTPRDWHALPFQRGIWIKRPAVILARFSRIRRAFENPDVVGDVRGDQCPIRVAQQVRVILIRSANATLSGAPNVAWLCRSVVRVGRIQIVEIHRVSVKGKSKLFV